MWDNCFIKNNQEIFLDVPDCTLQEQPEYNVHVMVASSLAWYNWYNSSYTMAAEPINSLEYALYNDPVFEEAKT